MEHLQPREETQGLLALLCELIILTSMLFTHFIPHVMNANSVFICFPLIVDPSPTYFPLLGFLL